ncbi:MAG: flagellar motor switch protein FliG [Paracoccaceae bacterium]|jgi:flagellar motor switch protein FliG
MRVIGHDRDVDQHIRATSPELSSAQKAAVIVRLLLNEGAAPSLGKLNPEMQAKLARHMTSLKYIDRTTLYEIVTEFAAALDAIALTFPHDLGDAVAMLEQHLSDEILSNLKQENEAKTPMDPWTKVVQREPEDLRPLFDSESAEVCAILLSKLPVAKAATLLATLPSDRALAIAHAVSLTGNVTPDVVVRIGAALTIQLQTRPASAFLDSPVDRIGAILNSASGAIRDAVLGGLDLRDASFASDVRRTIFTFVHIPLRVQPRDVPKIMRDVDPTQTVLALAAGKQEVPATVEFLLENMSQRLADSLREEVEARGNVPQQAGEIAMSAVVASIQNLVSEGDITLVEYEENETL